MSEADWISKSSIKPKKRLSQNFLIDQNIASVNEINNLQESVTEAVADALQFARESPYPNEEDLWEDLYADPLPA